MRYLYNYENNATVKKYACLHTVHILEIGTNKKKSWRINSQAYTEMSLNETLMLILSSLLSHFVGRQWAAIMEPLSEAVWDP